MISQEKKLAAVRRTFSGANSTIEDCQLGDIFIEAAWSDSDGVWHLGERPDLRSKEFTAEQVAVKAATSLVAADDFLPDPEMLYVYRRHENMVIANQYDEDGYLVAKFHINFKVDKVV